MDFFEHQARARRNTALLVLLFLAAVCATVATLYFVALLVVSVREAFRGGGGDSWWRPDVLWPVLAGAGGLIVGGSVWKIASLARGGPAVAKRIGAVRAPARADDPQLLRFRNVVEETAIACGLPAPAVYVLEKERAINAFVAGWTPADAAIVATRGALRLLDREELQGVVAHEFAHVLHGDMRMNIRMLGVLHGILVIGMLGEELIHRSVPSEEDGRRLRTYGIRVFVAGCFLAVVGYLGLFFGRLVKAAISRQREYLADATAVSITRDREGLAGALKKVGDASRGSRLRAPHAEEASHMYFASGIELFVFARALATHPPLADRIRRLDPSFDGTFPQVALPAPPRPAPAPLGRSPVRDPFDPGAVAGLVGTPCVEHLARGRHLLASIPSTLLEAARTPEGAAALACAIALGRGDPRSDAVRAESTAEEVDSIARLHAAAAALDPALRLPALDLAAPALRELPPERAAALRERIARIVEADRAVEPFEFAVARVVRERLAPPSLSRERHWAARPLAADIALVLSTLVHHGHHDVARARHAYLAGAGVFPELADHLAVAPPERRTFEALDAALDRLAGASPGVKRRVVEACARAVLADGRAAVAEAELLRAVCAALACPLPPFLPEATPPPSGSTPARRA